MGRASDEDAKPARWWGTDAVVLDDEEARRRLLEAAGRCIVRRGDAKIRMGEVADEAGVSRSTVYRYFQTRDELIIGLFLSRIGPAYEAVIARLKNPDDAAKSLPDLVLGPLSFIDASEVNQALFSAESRDMVISLELGSKALLDAGYAHFGPLLERWQASGQLHPDLDLRECMTWMAVVSGALLQAPWRERPLTAKRRFLKQYFVRALVDS